jgi:penicillin-binding protein 2
MSPSFDRRALSPFDPLSRNRRAHLARLAILVGLVVLTGGFFRLQVVQYAAHQAQSTSNQVRSIPLAAPRGFMYDRDGEIIAENLPAYSVSLMLSTDRDLRSDLESCGRSSISTTWTSLSSSASMARAGPADC